MKENIMWNTDNGSRKCSSPLLLSLTCVCSLQLFPIRNTRPSSSSSLLAQSFTDPETSDSRPPHHHAQLIVIINTICNSWDPVHHPVEHKHHLWSQVQPQPKKGHHLARHRHHGLPHRLRWVGYHCLWPTHPIRKNNLQDAPGNSFSLVQCRPFIR